jgi:hypothetical protein
VAEARADEMSVPPSDCRTRELAQYNRHMRQTVLRLVLSFALLVAITSCQSPRDRIVGKWKVDGASDTMLWEFSKNGAVKNGNMTGRYTFGDRNRLKIQTQFATFVYEIELSGDKMVWKDPNGSRTELARVQ